MQIIDAAEGHVPGILAIYNQVIATSTAIYTEIPATLADRTAWRAARVTAGFPVLVAVEGDEVLGFASFGEWRGAWPGYRLTVEHSVHVRDGLRGKGVGAALMEALIARGRAGGWHVMLASVDADNAGSIKFHERHGFEAVAHFRQVGVKFDRWLDMVFMQLTLDDAATPPAPR
ncbi:MAG: L-amino acid N-acyltransferase YncA [Paracoccaceae bacterium]|jgi:phosphinothricin acetyltransferase